MVAADPQGRACMIAAVEKQKFVYVLNRDSAANLTISSPLEAHKGHTIVFSVCALDVGFDNPVFAAIELDYQDADQVCSKLYLELLLAIDPLICFSTPFHLLWTGNLWSLFQKVMPCEPQPDQNFDNDGKLSMQAQGANG